MPTFDIVKEVKPQKSFRVASVMGKFDLQSEHIKEHFKGEIDFSQDWQIGVIYGHSGTGKTTIAKELFGEEYVTDFKFRAESILDDMPKEKSIDEITQTFNSVGFSSPPSWLKPYSVLSNGEKMRVNLARVILENRNLIVFDEFTSVVDRTVAKIGSAAVSKSIRRTDKKFIAVSCHDDIIEWLEPDWIFNTNNMSFEYARGRLRRPEIEIKVYEQKGMWDLFRKYHYLNQNLNNSARQFVAYYQDQPCGFCAVLHFPHPRMKNTKRVMRLVVLPDYQGIGIGFKLLNFVGDLFNNFRFRITTSTPALINSFQKSKSWRLQSKGGRLRGRDSKIKSLEKSRSHNRITTSWEYIH